MAQIAGSRYLIVYKQARDHAKRIFLLTRSFLAKERYSLTDQSRRSSRAVNAMIAESWARRHYPEAFINKITEAMETQARLDHAVDCSYVDDARYRELNDEWQQIGAMLNGMIDKADTFCTASAK